MDTAAEKRKAQTTVVTDILTGMIGGLEGHVPPTAIMIGLMACTEHYATEFIRVANEKLGPHGRDEAIAFFEAGVASLDATVRRLKHDCHSEPPHQVKQKNQNVN